MGVNQEDKDAVRAILARAIRNKDIPRASSLKCYMCGEKAKHYHHYAGYELKNALVVIALCIPCHQDAHREDGTLGRPPKYAEGTPRKVRVGNLTDEDYQFIMKWIPDPRDRADALMALAEEREQMGEAG